MDPSPGDMSSELLLERWRRRMSGSVLGAVALVSLVLNLAFSSRMALWASVVGVLQCALLFGLAVHPRVSAAVRGWVLAVLLLYGAVAALLGGGDAGASVTFLFTGLVLTSLFLGWRPALLLLGAGSVAFFVHWLKLRQVAALPAVIALGPAEQAVGTTILVLTLGVVVVLSMSFVQSRLKLALDDQLVAARALASEALERQATVEELTRANEALAENQARVVQAGKVELLGQLAGTVAHDLNNVLTVVLAEADLAREDAPEQAASIQEAVDEAVQLTRQLLVVGRQDLARPEVVDLGGLLEDCRKLLTRVTPSEVQLCLQPAPAVVRADPVQVRQVLLNLASNAVQAMPEGGTLTVRTEADGEEAVLTVSDTGVGMDEGTRQRIFEPFFSTREAEVGSGLGLVSVHFVVEQLGGDIRCTSAPGAGTTFAIRLPRCEAQPTSPRVAAEPDSAIDLRGRVVLVVDDEHRLRHTLASALRTTGAEVIEAADARAAIALAGLEEQLDVVWTDVRMPHGGGKAVVDWVEEHRPGTAVIVSSGFADDPTLREALTAGRHPFVPKPFTAAQAVAAVSSVLTEA